MGRIITSIIILAVMSAGCFISVGVMNNFTDKMSVLYFGGGNE